MMASAVSGPPALPLLGHAPWFLRDKPGFLLACYRRYGEVVRLQLGGPTFLVVAPGDVRHVLVAHADNYGKSERVVGAAAQRAIGLSVLTAESGAHRHLRRTLQPWFRQDALAARVPRLVGLAERAVCRWVDGGEIEVFWEARDLARDAVLVALLGEPILERFPQLGELIEMRRRYVESLFGVWPVRLTRAQRAYRRLHPLLIGILDEILKRGGRGGALAQVDGSASALSCEEQREQLLALLVAGYETTAAMMEWALCLLARHVDSQRRCVESSYAELVVAETLRLYPPTWMFVRVARAGDRLPSGAAIPAGAKIYLSQYVSHRQPAIFPDPEHFVPDRFTGAAIPAFAYFPFGGGSRSCIGESLARSIGTTLLTSIVRDTKLSLISAHEPGLVPGLTLRPRGPIHVAARRRST